MRKYLFRMLSLFMVACIASAGMASASEKFVFPAGVQKICFSKGEHIYVISVNEKKARRVVKGTDPAIAPNGDAVAFTYNYSDGRAADRTIKIIELATKKIQDFKALSDVISYGAQWSPDGTKIAFNVMKDSWQVGVLDPASGAWNSLTKDLSGDFFLSAWVSDSSLLVCNLDTLYEISVNGQVIRQFPIAKLIEDAALMQGLSSATRFALSPDKGTIVFDTTGGPDDKNIIWAFDIERQTFARVTPDTMDGQYPQWLPSGKEILFESWQGEDQFQGVSISIDGAHPVTVIENARDISYASK